MVTIIKYGLFFAGVFVVFMAIAVFAFFGTMGGSAGVLGWYMEYDHDLGQFTAFKTKISFYQGQHEHHATGTWSHNVFYPEGKVGDDSAAIAHILPNEDLVMDLNKFDPPVPLEVTAVLFERVPGTFHPYPLGSPDDKESYPPPKGMIKPGMLECDLANLPWQPFVKDPVIMDPYHPNDHSAFGTNISNGFPRTWHYKSDDPKLSELRVLVEKGHVTEVNGGAEDAQGTDYPTPSIPEVGADNGSNGWIHWLIGVVLGK
jgi:hypothetical protein